MTQHPRTNPPLRFPDGNFAFYTAEYGSWAGDARIVFRVRDAHERAAEKGIRHFHRLVPSWPHEIGRWLIAHPNHPIA